MLNSASSTSKYATATRTMRSCCALLSTYSACATCSFAWSYAIMFCQRNSGCDAEIVALYWLKLRLMSVGGSLLIVAS